MKYSYRVHGMMTIANAELVRKVLHDWATEVGDTDAIHQWINDINLQEPFKYPRLFISDSDNKENQGFSIMLPGSFESRNDCITSLLNKLCKMNQPFSQPAIIIGTTADYPSYIINHVEWGPLAQIMRSHQFPLNDYIGDIYHTSWPGF